MRTNLALVSGGKNSVSVEGLYTHLSPAVYASESQIVTLQALGLDMIHISTGSVKVTNARSKLLYH